MMWNIHKDAVMIRLITTGDKPPPPSQAPASRAAPIWLLRGELRKFNHINEREREKTRENQRVRAARNDGNVSGQRDAGGGRCNHQSNQWRYQIERRLGKKIPLDRIKFDRKKMKKAERNNSC